MRSINQAPRIRETRASIYRTVVTMCPQCCFQVSAWWVDIKAGIHLTYPHNCYNRCTADLRGHIFYCYCKERHPSLHIWFLVDNRKRFRLIYHHSRGSHCTHQFLECIRDDDCSTALFHIHIPSEESPRPASAMPTAPPGSVLTPGRRDQSPVNPLFAERQNLPDCVSGYCRAEWHLE